MRAEIRRAWGTMVSSCSPPADAAEPAHVTVRNQLATKVSVQGATRTWHLGPLGSEIVDRRVLDAELDRALLEASGAIAIDERDLVEPGERWFAHVAALTGVVAVVSLVLVVAFTAGWAPVIVWGSVTAVVVAAVGTAGRGRAAEVGRWVKEKAALCLVLLAGFGIPAITLLFTTGLFARLRGDVTRALEPSLSGIVTLRALQVLFLGVAIVFPALLYFLFDRQRADTLRRRFAFHMFRLDPRVSTSIDVEALYGRQMEEAFGSQLHARSNRQQRLRHRSPMVVATIVLAIGWIVALINLDAVPLGEDAGALNLSRLFEPEPNVLAFGFLGAYFFAVNAVLRSYVRGDLQPKAYSQITARVLIVAVLASVVAMTQLGDNRAVVAVAFFAGIVPDTVLQWIWEGVRGRRRSRAHRSAPTGARPDDRDAITENQPLTELDGIDLYERARLAGEGVANVEALAHGNLVDLLLQTRIPAGRLIDWVDQSVLYLHTAFGAGRRELFDLLRGLGVRTATDFLIATDRPAGRQHLLAAVGSPHLTAPHLDLLRGAMADAEWMVNLRAWRANLPPSPVTVVAPRSPSASPTTNGARNGHRPTDGDVRHPPHKVAAPSSTTVSAGAPG